MDVQSSNFMVTVEVKEHSNVSDNRFYPEVDRKRIFIVSEVVWNVVVAGCDKLYTCL